VAGFEARYPENAHVVAARRLINGYEHYEPDGDVDSWREEATREGLPEPQIQGRSIFDDLLA
jgi:hypothetical protein